MLECTKKLYKVLEMEGDFHCVFSGFQEMWLNPVWLNVQLLSYKVSAILDCQKRTQGCCRRTPLWVITVQKPHGGHVDYSGWERRVFWDCACCC